jgi:hypothetical protein
MDGCVVTSGDRANRPNFDPPPEDPAVLAATDEPAEWWIDLNDPSTARPDHAKADPILQGSQSSLLLWLTHRAPDGSLKMISYREIATSWAQLRR